IRRSDHPGVTSLRTLEALLPFIDLVDDGNVLDLWNLCNERSWYDWRRKNVDFRLSEKWRKTAGVDETLLFEELDEFVNGSRSIGFIEHWIEHFEKRGDPHNRLMTGTKHWLEQRRTIAALKVAAQILTVAGRRDDLTVLNSVEIEPQDEAKAVRNDTEFAVFHRTLV
ncbi:MAG: hypothetical protein OEU26_16945, partial [Candidatus Tectomicrobia bacterium]|nr:hypothetical protein [Candidatus Tectomicrobia bacterium]